MPVKPDTRGKKCVLASPRPLGLAALGIFSLPIFFVSIQWLGLYSDDWFHLATAAKHWQHLFIGWGTWPRPVEGVFWLGSYTLFGTYLPGYYVLLFSIQVMSAGALFLTLIDVLPDKWELALVTSVLFLVFPTDQSRFWLSTQGYRLGTLFLLLSAYLAGRWRGRKARLNSTFSIIFYGLSIFTNEIFLPLLIVPALIRWRGQGRSLKVLLKVSLPYVAVLALYAIYRLTLPHLLGTTDPKIGLLGASVDQMIYKLRRALEVNFGNAWGYSLQRLRELNLQGLLVVGSGTAVVIVTLGLLLTPNKRHHHDACDARTLRPRLLGDLAIFALGTLLMFVGYLPILPTAYGIGLGTIDSRVSIGASLGASLATVSLVHALTTLPGVIARRRWVADCLFLVCSAWLVFVAAGQQYAVRQDYARAWNKQCNIWRQMFAQVPDLDDDAYVIIASVPRWEGSTCILSSNWEVGSALQLLYDNESVRGDVLPSDELPLQREEGETWRFQFHSSDFAPRNSQERLSYEHLVLFEYGANQNLRILYARPNWAPADLPEIRTHPQMIGEEAVTPEIRDIIQSPFGFPWEAKAVPPE